MRRRRAIVAGLAVGALLGALSHAWRPSRRRRRVAAGFWTLVAAPVVAVVALAADWVDDVVDGAAGVLGTILRPVIGFVRRIIRAVVNVLEDIIGALGRVAKEGLKWLTGSVNWLVDSVNNIGGTLFHHLANWWWQTIQYVGDVVYNATAPLRYLIDGARQLATYAANLARDLVAGAIRWATDHILRPFLDFVRGIYNWVRDNIWDPLWAKAHELWRDVVGQVRQVIDWATTAVRFVADWGAKLIRFVEFVGRTIGDVIEFTTRAITGGPRWLIDEMRRAIQKEGATLEDLFVRWLGL